MSEWIESFVDSWGIVAIGLLMFLENVFPPIPSELVMPLGGYLSGDGKFPFWAVVLVATAGSVAGAIVLYYLGAWIGKDRLKRWADKHGKWLTLTGDDIEKADNFFDKHGGKAVFICRLIPGLRSLISIPAGFAHMKMGPFLIYTTIGSLIWNTALGAAGHALGKEFGNVEKYMGPISMGMIGVMVLTIIVFVWRRSRSGHGRQERSASAT